MPLQDKEGIKENSRTLLLGGKEFLHQLNKEEVSYAIVCKPVVVTKIDLSYLPVVIQDMLSEFGDINLPNELPPIRNISHHMDFITGVSLPNKVAYRMNPQENE